MKKIIIISLCLFIIIILNSCYTAQQTQQAMHNCFMGKHYSEFLPAMGIPTQDYEDGRGGKILEWSQTSQYTTNAYSRTTTTTSGNNNTSGNYNVSGNNIYGQENTYSNNTTKSNTTTRPARTYSVQHYIRLYVDKDGIIYHVAWYLSRNTAYEFTKKWYQPE